MTVMPEPPLSPRSFPQAVAARPLTAWLAGRIALDSYLSLAERLAGEVAEPGGRGPTLVVSELEPIITIGRAGSRTDVLATDEELRTHRLGVRFVGRGGGAVLHGPGQVAVGLFAALGDLGMAPHDVGGLLGRLESGLESALVAVGCCPRRISGGLGLRGHCGLLAAIGVAVRRGVVRHGAFVNVSLAHGVRRRVRSVTVGAGGGAGGEAVASMGSIEAELRRRVRLQEVRSALVRGVADAFGFPNTHIQAGFPLPPVARTLAPEVLGRVG
jgi:lipoyl(octanoyl) transferase